ncbi:hypothetical protein EON65_31745 [archaeon]|nr:MAG: hypothetical protein EON65_31745 [archaeon]
MLVTIFLSLFVALTMLLFLDAFRWSQRARGSRSTSLHALDKKVVERLDFMKDTYNKVINVVSGEAETEASNLKDAVEKYNKYLEVMTMMAKLRAAYKDESLEQRKARQLKSFLGLYRGKVELENQLLEKLGLPANQSVNTPEMQKFMMLEEEVKSLEAKLAELQSKSG